MKMMTLVEKTVSVALVFLCLSSLAIAQGVGAIAGTVQDATGGVIPGVAVVLSNPGTIGGNQQAVTDERGAYQFMRLVPRSNYSVKAELAGFRTAVRENVIVNADATARVDLTLNLGETSETLTVTGEAPLLDTTAVLTQTVMGREILDKLPTGRDLWTVSRMVPAVAINKYDVGGSDSLGQSAARVHGSRPLENDYMIDGMDTSTPSSGGTSASYYDTAMFQEVNYQTGNASAEYQRGGIVYNMITKTGTNVFHGAFSFTGTNQHLQANNVTPALLSDLLAAVPAKVLQANPNFLPGTKILTFLDGASSLSGPIVRDQLWFSASYQRRTLNRLVIGSYNTDGTQMVDDNRQYNYSIKLSWQVSSGSQLQYLHNMNYRAAFHRNNGSLTTPRDFYDARATWIQDFHTPINQLKWTATLSPRLVLDTAISLMSHDSPRRRQDAVQPGDIPRYDIVTSTYTVAWEAYGKGPQYTGGINAGLNYIIGSHDLKVGYQFGRGNVGQINYSTSNYPSGLRANYRNGVPDSVNTYNTPNQSVALSQDHGVFIQDKWMLTRKLTANLGLRLQKTNGWVPAVCQVETIFIKGQCFSEVKNVPDWLDLSPRFGLIYDVSGDGKTALKLAANRYYIATGTSYPNRVNPITLARDTRSWIDLSGDEIPQLNELGSSTGFNLGTTNHYATEVKRPYVNELNVEVERQLPGEIVVALGYFHRELRRNIGSKNLAVPLESYTPLQVTERSSGRQVTVYNQSPALLGQFNVLFDNFPGLDGQFNGVDLTFNKRLSNHWMIMSGLAVGRGSGDINETADLNNPNNNVFRRGLDANDVPFAFKAAGIYELPYGISVSESVQHFSGWPQADTVTIGSNTVALTQVSQSLRVTPQDGSVRLPAVNTVDLAARKTFGIGEQVSAEPVMEIFNLMNANPILGRTTQLGPAYHRASSILGGRVWRFGLNVKF